MTETENTDTEEATEEKIEEEEREEVPPALLKKALALFRSLVRGNGIKPESVDLKSFEGEVLNFEAWERFEIEPKIGEKHQTGREQGEVLGSVQELRAKIRNTMEKVTQNKDVKKQTISILDKRDDLGFGQDNLFILLDRFKKIFVVHEQCTTCSGAMAVLCQTCHGDGRAHCTQCRGQKEMTCTFCQGTQFQNTPDGKQQCIQCHGRGKMACDLCHQTGEIPCKVCKASGKIPCKNCAGTGWNSLVSHLEVRSKSLFDYKRELLPEEERYEFPEGVPALIEDLRSELVTEEHADITFIEDKTREEELERASKENEYIIPYHVRLPWGDIVFSLQGKTLKGKLFGFQPALIDIPPFLEKTAKRGLSSLDAAAHAPGNVSAKINEAVRFRAIGEAFLASARHSKKRAIETMHERYPFGFSSQTIEKMVKQSDLALKRVTKKPRTIGLLIGLVVAMALYGLYYIGPGRASLMPYIPAGPAEFFIDFFLILLGGTLTTLVIQYTAAKALHDAIGKLLPQKKKKTLMPKAGQSALWGYAGGFIVYFIMLETAIATGMLAPGWHTALLKIAGLS